MNGNDFMAWVLRSPFHSILSGGMMLITVTGRKTGRRYTTPVGYFEEDNYLWILTSRDRIWWRNLRDGAIVSLLIKRKPVSGFAELELERSKIESLLASYLRHVPQSAKPMKIRIENGKPNADDIARAANERLFVRVKLAGQPPK